MGFESVVKLEDSESKAPLLGEAGSFESVVKLDSESHLESAPLEKVFESVVKLKNIN